MFHRSMVRLSSPIVVLLLGCAAPEALGPRASAAARPQPPAREPAPRGAIAEPLSLEFIDDFNAPRPPPGDALDAPGARWDAALGGLSGLYYDRPSATLYAVSDLPRRFEPRLYAFNLELTDESLRVAPRAVFFYHDGTSSASTDDFDAESISSDGNGGFYVGTESAFDRPGQPLPRIVRMQSDGLLGGALALPDAYLPSADGVPHGTRSNRAFEGLALSPSGRWLTAIVESTLQQDGDEASFEHGASVRLLRWDLAAGGAPAEYFYPIEPMRRPLHGTPAGGNNGVSELVSLDDRRLLVLERGYVPLGEGHGPNTIRIYEATIPDEAALPGAPPLPLAKRLVLDLDEIVPKLEPGQQSLDNMEGMTMGPRLPSGAPSLLLVSDDNFGADQRTVFLAFRIRGLNTE